MCAEELVGVWREVAVPDELKIVGGLRVGETFASQRS